MDGVAENSIFVYYAKYDSLFDKFVNLMKRGAMLMTRRPDRVGVRLERRICKPERSPSPEFLDLGSVGLAKARNHIYHFEI